MKTNTSQEIVKLIQDNSEVTVNQLVSHFGFTQAAIHRQLNKLLDNGLVEKYGNPPRVFYRVKIDRDQGPLDSVKNNINKNDLEVINQEFIYISPLGKVNYGIKGFKELCKKFNLDIEKTVREYIKTHKKYSAFKRKGLIDGKEKLKNTFPEIFLNEMHYLDFYSIERFGKTKLGALVLYAKQSQSRAFIKQVAENTKDKVEKVIKEKNIDAVCFIPHTLPRKVQFINEIEKYLNLKLPSIKLIKVINDIPVAQKTLNKLDDRIENAASTIFVKDTLKYNKVLLIDDAVGSGATMNESARKLKEKNIAKKVIGLAITGSYKGFEVLNEV